MTLSKIQLTHLCEGTHQYEYFDCRCVEENKIKYSCCSCNNELYVELAYDFYSKDFIAM